MSTSEQATSVFFAQMLVPEPVLLPERANAAMRDRYYAFYQDSDPCSMSRRLNNESGEMDFLPIQRLIITEPNEVAHVALRQIMAILVRASGKTVFKLDHVSSWRSRTQGTSCSKSRLCALAPSAGLCCGPSLASPGKVVVGQLKHGADGVALVAVLLVVRKPEPQLLGWHVAQRPTAT